MIDTDLHHFYRLRDLFARRDFEAVLQDPFARKFPLNQALRSWAAFLEQKNCPPASLEISQQPLSVLCQQALLWAALGKETGEQRYQQAANRLAGMLAPIVQFPALWTLESEYLKEETLIAVDVFRRALGHPSERKIPEGFFSELEHLTLVPEEPTSRPYEQFEQDGDAMVYLLEGNRAALGAARLGPTQILAFGLQTNPQSFGVDIVNDYVRKEEVWIHVERRAFAFSLQSTGLKAPLYLAFYLDAKQCVINEKIFKPRSLNKFQGSAEKIQFDGVCLTPNGSFPTELIPLAGDNSFWGATFLLTFRLPLSGKINVQIAK